MNMKQKFYSILLTALLGLFGMQVQARGGLSTVTIGSAEYYEIGTGDDLVAFAALVNGGTTTANAILTADIDLSSVMSTWTPIGDWNTGAVSSAYCGHFDGQGHTISGFNATATQNYYGIFGVISTGALIENFTIYGTVSCSYKTMGVVGYARDATPTIRGIHSYLNINNTAAGNRHGGILGSSVNGTIIVERCTYSGTLDGNDAGGNGNYGGIVGYVNNHANAHLRVTNCLFDGKLINSAAAPGNCTFGGMVGYVGGSPDVILTNCLSIGTLQSAITGQFYGAVKHNTCSIINSFYQGDNINGSASTVTPTTQEVTTVTAEQLASGEVAYKLGEAWSQLLGTESSPIPTGINPVSYVGDAGYATLYDTTTGYTLGGDVKAYVAILNNTWLDLSEVENVPAGTPVVLKGSYYNKLAADLPELNVVNDLKGTDADTAADGTMYILANGPDGIGFYKAEGTIPAGKAYYQSTSGVKVFHFDADDATGISLNGQWSMDDDQPIYNLAGQRILKARKGINIMGGKKVLY